MTEGVVGVMHAGVTEITISFGNFGSGAVGRRARGRHSISTPPTALQKPDAAPNKI